MNDALQVLLIVEGPKEEKRFFGLLKEAFGLPLDIVVYATNIYDLFRRIEKERVKFGESYLNVRDVLLEKIEDEEQRLLLQRDFAFTYLIYDCDIHHHDPNCSPSPEERRDRNLPVLRRMLEQFVDETDETVGKLYVNYPMMESWRDADACFEDAYRDRFIALDESGDYKTLAGSRILAGKLGKGFDRDELSRIIRMMVWKLNSLNTGNWSAPEYDDYRKLSDGVSVLDVEERLMREHRQIGVLNTSAFLLLDYLGNKHGDYDRIAKGEKNGALVEAGG